MNEEIYLASEFTNLIVIDDTVLQHIKELQYYWHITSVSWKHDKLEKYENHVSVYSPLFPICSLQFSNFLHACIHIKSVQPAHSRAINPILGVFSSHNPIPHINSSKNHISSCLKLDTTPLPSLVTTGFYGIKIAHDTPPASSPLLLNVLQFVCHSPCTTC